MTERDCEFGGCRFSHDVGSGTGGRKTATLAEDRGEKTWEESCGRNDAQIATHGKCGDERYDVHGDGGTEMILEMLTPTDCDVVEI